MRKPLLIFLLFALSSLRGLATGNYSAQWQKGTSCYEQAKYDSAAWYFEEIAALKPKNVEVYYNLGNTYYRLNKVALAVLNYQRALQIEPGYKEAKDNLLLTESRISNRIQPTGDIFFIDWWQNMTHPRKASAWAIAAIITFTLIIVCLAVRRFVKSGDKLPMQLPGILGFICICFLVLAFAAAQRTDQATAAVVMQNDAPLMNNEQKGKPLALVPEGTTVKIVGEKGTWTEVTLPDGRTGWLPQNLLTKI
jgi:tetratricopeptide (TPR) repeat protein